MIEEKISFEEIINIIETRRNNAYRKVNEELVNMYWDIGRYVSEKINNALWGDKTIKNLAEYLKAKYLSLKGFDRSGIYRMKQFYEIYKDNQIVAPLVRQINWTNNKIILGATKSKEEREFYLKLCIQNNYSKRELERQIKSSYYERYMLSNDRLNDDLKLDCEKYIKPRILDTYSLEFLNLPKVYSEKELRKEIILNLKEFILEIGNDFAFISEEYRIEVSNESYYIDLLLFNRSLNCLVAFELKIGKFRPEYISKMNFYLEALDMKEKKKCENPSVGIILCTSKNKEVVKYALSRSISKTKVSEYILKLPNKKVLEDKLSRIRNSLNL